MPGAGIEDVSVPVPSGPPLSGTVAPQAILTARSAWPTGSSPIRTGTGPRTGRRELAMRVSWPVSRLMACDVPACWIWQFIRSRKPADRVSTTTLRHGGSSGVARSRDIRTRCAQTPGRARRMRCTGRKAHPRAADRRRSENIPGGRPRRFMPAERSCWPAARLAGWLSWKFKASPFRGRSNRHTTCRVKKDNAIAKTAN